MPLPTVITDLSQTAASNYPAGSDSPNVLDDTQRAHASFIALLRDGKGHTNPASLASAGTTDIGGQNTLFVEISGTTSITSFGTTYYGPRFLRFLGALTLTHSASLSLPGSANITTVAGDTCIAVPNQALNGWNVVQYQRGAGLWASSGANSDITSMSATTDIDVSRLNVSQINSGLPVPMNYLTGCTMSTAGASATMTIAAGAAGLMLGSLSPLLMDLSSAIAKTTSAWAVGTAAGGLDTGAIANSTWYHFWVIRRQDTGVVDVLISLSATAPTMPANYTQKRRIGSGKTNGSAQWTLFVQTGDYFEWDVATLVSGAAINNPGTAAVSRTLDVPTGVVVEAVFNGGTRNGASAVAGGVYFSALSKADAAASETAAPLWNSGAYTQSAAAGARSSYVTQRIFTNTSAQIRSRLSASDANVDLYIATLGWRDSRGRDA